MSLVGVLVLGACLNSDLPTRHDIGYIGVNTPANGQGGATVQALFFRDPGGLRLPDSHFVTDSCESRPFVPGSTALTPGVSVEYVSAGDSVTMQTDSAVGYLKPKTSSNGTTSYVLPNGASLPLTFGSKITFVVPGAPDAFPALTVTGLTPSPYQLGPIDTLPSTTTGLPISWGPAGDDSSAIIVSLQYASSGSTTLNTQIYCSLQDDGQDTIPGRLLDGWRKSTGLRHVDSYRWRSAFAGGQSQLLDLVAQYNVSKSTFP